MKSIIYTISFQYNYTILYKKEAIASMCVYLLQISTLPQMHKGMNDCDGDEKQSTDDGLLSLAQCPKKNASPPLADQSMV